MNGAKKEEVKRQGKYIIRERRQIRISERSVFSVLKKDIREKWQK